MHTLLLLACADPPLAVDSAQAVEAFKALHGAVYDVYGLGPDRDAIWDLLSQSFAGPALTREYVEHYTAAVHMVEDQTAIDVRRVDYELAEVVELLPDRVLVEADWSVGGVVTHQAHKHPRVNRYRAVYTLQPVHGELRITGTRMRNLERVISPLSMGGGWMLDEVPASGQGFMDPLDLLRAGVLQEDGAGDANGEGLDDAKP